jgi:hypothetical protein
MDAKLIFFLIVIVFSGIQSIIKAANEKAAAKQKQARVGGQGGQGGRNQVQSEIESFLQEVTGKHQPQAPAAASRPSDDIQEQRDRERLSNRKQEAAVRKRDAQAKSQQAAQKQKQKARSNKGVVPTGQSRSRKPNERRIGSMVNEHVDSYIGKHVETYLDHDVDEYVESTITQSVQRHLGGASDASRPKIASRGSTAGAKKIVALLRDPQGVRNAVLINEILSRPRSMRK